MKRFSVEINGRGLCVYADGVPVISGIRVRLSFVRTANVVYAPREIICEEERVRVRLERAERYTYTESKDAELIFAESDGVLSASVSLTLSRYTLAPSGGVCIDFSLVGSDAATSLYQKDPCWIYPEFGTDAASLRENTECLSARLGAGHICILPVGSASAAARLSGGAFSLDTRVFGARELSTAFAVVALADSPYAAIYAATRTLRRKTPDFPDCLCGLGWCTWESFGPSVSADKIIEKLEEYKSAGRSPRWVLIDDGWATYRDGRLLDFRADLQKFPDGLGALVERMRREYGVRHVGVWCAMNGHWGGLDGESKYAAEHREELYRTCNGTLLPGDSADAIYRFWDSWFSYLRGEGIDFVKVDNQGNVPQCYDGDKRGTLACEALHRGLDAAAQKHFGGALINCMGASIEQAAARVGSALVRCSGDYIPDRPDHLAYHITQCVYCAAVLSRFHICDYDMFYTDHGWAHANAMTCALSGGPLYTSDKMGKTASNVLHGLADADGATARFDAPLVPTLDCFYTDCAAAGVPLKAFTSAGENFAVCAYGFTKGRAALGTLELSHIPASVAAAEKYLVHDYFADKYFLFNKGDVLPIELGYEECALYSFYPVRDGTVAVGERGRYAEAAEKPCFVGDVSELL